MLLERRMMVGDVVSSDMMVMVVTWRWESREREVTVPALPLTSRLVGFRFIRRITRAPTATLGRTWKSVVSFAHWRPLT